MSMVSEIQNDLGNVQVYQFYSQVDGTHKYYLCQKQE